MLFVVMREVGRRAADRDTERAGGLAHWLRLTPRCATLFVALGAAGMALAISAPTALADSLSITVSPSTPIEETPFQITVSGTAPEGVLLVYVLGSPSCPIAPWEAARQGARLTPEGGETLAGSFTKTYPVSGPQGDVGCAYIEVGEPSGSSTQATAEAHFGVRPAVASLSVNVSPSSVLAGRPIAVEVTGTTEVAGVLEGRVYATGTHECYGGTELADNGSEAYEECASAFGTPARVGPGPFDIHLSYVPTENGPDQVWFRVGRVRENTTSRYTIGEARITLPRAPLPAPSLIGPAESWRSLPGAMTFSWSAPPFGEDTLVIRSTAKMIEGDGEEYLVTAERFKYGKLDAWRSLGGLGTWTSDPPTGATTVQIRSPNNLGPGEYTWEVQRANGPEKAASPKRRLMVYSPPATVLKVRPQSHREATSVHPGYTDVIVTTTPWTNITLTLTHGKYRSTEQIGWGSSSTLFATIVRWSCARPAGIYRYVVTARGDSGGPLRRTGSFRTVTAAQCASMKLREAQTREHRRSEQDAQRKREEREAIRRQQEETERFDANCKAIGGTPVILHTSAGTEIGCRSPLGGLLPVPV
ncbi:MAG TPA: hypothetical protein VMU32_00625 [Solirubrobacteraceae bacterium]|nr:hypothetical protein [Solirubrobacteraceae bacterium]